MIRERIEVYGKVDCVDTLRSRALLESLGIPYVFHDVVADDVSRERASFLGGGPAVPVIVIGRAVLVEPTNPELAAALGR